MAATPLASEAQVELDQHFVRDEVVRHPWIDDPKLLPVDLELARPVGGLRVVSGSSVYGGHTLIQKSVWDSKKCVGRAD